MKKKLAKMSAFLMALLMTAGCSSQSAPPSSAVPETPSSSAQESSGPAQKLKVGIIQPMEHLSLNMIREAIIEEFSAMGLDDRIEVDYQNAQGDPSNLSTIVNKMIGDGVDVLVPIALSTAQACAAATKEIPIVFAAASYPVEGGLVKSLEETDGNITGVSNAIAIPEIFELAGTLTPDARTFGFVYNTSEINSNAGIKRAKDYCDANGLSYVEATVTSTGEVAQAAQSLAGRVDAIFTPNDNTVASAMSTLANEAIKMGLPTYVGADSMVMDGGLATVGIDYTVLGKQVARMVSRIAIDGEPISQNPIEVVGEYAKMINTTTADALGIEIPQEMKDTFKLFE